MRTHRALETNTSVRSLGGILFAAILALSLVASTQDALARTRGSGALPNIFDPGIVDPLKNLPRPVGSLGASWE